MSPSTIAALLGLGASLVVRRARAVGRLGLEDWVLALGLGLGVTALVATILAWVGRLGPGSLALCFGAVALAAWPWSRPAQSGPHDPHAPGDEEGRGRGRLQVIVLGVLVVLGVGLRMPPIDAPLAGRDQGTYALRAATTVRTGSLGWTDPVLAAAGAELSGRATPAGALDILGLYPTSPSSEEGWRVGVYEGAYRPGSYLAARDIGQVTPQFFHLHPMLLAVGLVAVGPWGASLMVAWVSALWLMALACIVKRLWPSGLAAGVALALVAISPVAIWTGRMPLSENPMALFESLALLVALRIGSDLESDTEPWWLAACLALSAGVRGNAVMILPLVLALAWLRPRRGGPQAAWLILAGLVASGVIHGLTVYPYIHDEIMRRVAPPIAGPRVWIAAMVAGAAVWLAVDQLVGDSRWKQLRARILAASPRVLVVAFGAAVGMWAVLRLMNPPGPPYSRLDAAPILLGLPLSVVALAGVAWFGWRWRPTPAQTWLVALAAIVPATAWIYAARGLPTLAFFYYGRYLVPELVPAASLAAGFVVAQVEQRTRERWSGAWPSRVLAGGVGSILVASVGGPLLVHPQLRLREYEPAADAIAWLAERIPEQGIVIAGGEGWHNGHTHNQVGGALAMAHGRAIVPYRTREDAYLSAWELLVAGPARRGVDPPPVYLLVNEAAHPYTDDEGRRIALFDDLLWAPFVAERVDLLELYVDALSPAPDRLPTRVARHELRMALVELRVDPEALAAIETHRFEGPESCVSASEVLRLELPRSPGAHHVIFEAGDLDLELAELVPRWRVRVDGELLAFEPPRGLRPHARASLGPVPLPPAQPGVETLQIEIRGVDSGRDRDAEGCANGRLAAVRLVPRERSQLGRLRATGAVEARTFGPRRDLGHPVEPIAWVGGRSLSRYRPGTEPQVELSGLAIVVEAGASVEFAPIDLPLDDAGVARPLDLVLTLAKTRLASPGRVQVWADDALIGELEVPAMRERSWVAPPLAWTPSRARARLRVELLGEPTAKAGDAIEVRDLALFERSPAVGSQVD